jgi:1-acyl-sn-glycerol-3-phosphate acyltransferase
MLYKIFKVIVSFTLKIFFRKIYLSGLENLDNSKPQILASNHPNGFLEPLLMACFFTRPLYFLVRGDVFDNKFLKPILVATHQIPIFRFKDGFSKMRENTQTLQASSDVLLDGKCLLIFAEGSTKCIKMLRPLQKGLSRITFDTLARDPNIDLEILPVGINFTHNTLFNKEVMI